MAGMRFESEVLGYPTLTEGKQVFQDINKYSVVIEDKTILKHKISQSCLP